MVLVKNRVERRTSLAVLHHGGLLRREPANTTALVDEPGEAQTRHQISLTPVFLLAAIDNIDDTMAPSWWTRLTGGGSSAASAQMDAEDREGLLNSFRMESVTSIFSRSQQPPAEPSLVQVRPCRPLC